MIISEKYIKPKVIAEIGCNHKGCITTAKEMIKLAKDCGCDIVKFQKRNSKELLTEQQYNAPYINNNSYGKTYGEHREFLEFSAKQHYELHEFSHSEGIIYTTSVWDVSSAKEIIGIDPPLIKVPSACNNNTEMLSILLNEFGNEVHISTGMSKQEEIENVVTLFRNCPERLILYACTSGYPVPYDDVCLLELLNLNEKYYSKKKIGGIGFSGHHTGIAIDILTPLLNASYVERHFTMDRSWRGSDHAASLEPQGLKKLCRDLTNASQAWKYKTEEILDIEQTQRTKLKYREDD